MHLLHDGVCGAAVADEPFRDDGALLGKVVIEIAADGRVPVDVPVAGDESGWHGFDSAGDGCPSLAGDPSISATTWPTTTRVVRFVESGMTLRLTKELTR